MSLDQIKLCSFILREHFGEVAEKIVNCLLRKGSTPLRPLTTECGFTLDKVKRSLAALIQHGIVTFEPHKAGFVEYFSSVDNILCYLFFPQIINCTKSLFGDESELIIEELLHQGQLTMSSTINKVSQRLAQTESSQDVYGVRDKFVDLIKTQFLKKCPRLMPDSKGSAPTFKEESDNPESAFAVPELDLADMVKRKRKLSEDENEDHASKKRKLENSAEKCGDEGVYWTINHTRFQQYLRDQAIVDAVSRKVDTRAGEIMACFIRISELKTAPDSITTNPVTYNEIFQSLPKEMEITRQILDQYLRIIVEDTKDFLQKVGDSGGGMYAINFQRAFKYLCQVHVESVIGEKYGSKCLRVYRLLAMKGHLEQKQIEEMAMIPAKEAKEMLYTLFDEQLVTIKEVPKTPDHAPSRTFYLFGIHLNQVARMLLQKTTKAMLNVCLRRTHETQQHRRLLEKQQRMEAIIASMENLKEEQRMEIEEMVTPAEKAQLSKIKSMTHKLEQCESQLSDTMFVMEMYIKYAHMK